jgi:hypothetical protein
MAIWPNGGTSGVRFGTQPVVTIREGSDNLIVANATNSVTATITPVSGSGTLTGTTTVAAVAGVARFTDLAIVGVGVFNMLFTSPGLTGTSIQVTITNAGLDLTTTSLLSVTLTGVWAASVPGVGVDRRAFPSPPPATIIH